MKSTRMEKNRLTIKAFFIFQDTPLNASRANAARPAASLELFRDDYLCYSKPNR